MIAQSALVTTDRDLSASLERSELLTAIPWVRHGVTRRVPGLGLADGNVGYTAPRDEADAWEMRQLWVRSIGIDPGSMVRVRQTHGNRVHIATDADLQRGAHPDATEAPIADSIVTNVPGLALTTLHADCLAMFIVDPIQRVIATVHAGWRSTVLDITGETVRTMTNAFTSRPEDLRAFVGPSIGAERYQVGPEVVEAWSAISEQSNAVRLTNSGSNFDLKVANQELLLRSGLNPQHIEVSRVCTASDPENWFSHRGQGPLTGRFAAIIAIAGDQS